MYVYEMFIYVHRLRNNGKTGGGGVGGGGLGVLDSTNNIIVYHCAIH